MGPKLSLTEFQYGGYEDITGTIALTHILSIPDMLTTIP